MRSYVWTDGDPGYIAAEVAVRDLKGSDEARSWASDWWIGPYTDSRIITRSEALMRPAYRTALEAWEEIEEGHWRRTCQCWSEDIYEPRVDTRTRLDPLDPSTFRHGGGCEHRDTTDPTIVKAILRVHDREDYWWVECSACAHGWQVPYYAVESAG